VLSAVFSCGIGFMAKAVGTAGIITDQGRTARRRHAVISPCDNTMHLKFSTHTDIRSLDAIRASL
jgi:hypothetical protein